MKFWIGLGMLISWAAASQASCPISPVPENGYINGDSESYVQYFCRNGYKLNGQTENFCLGDHWAFEPPTCDITYCPPLKPMTDGEFFPHTTEHGTVVKFTCLYMTELEGNKEIECINGKWSHSQPNCTLGSCQLTKADLKYKHLSVKYGTPDVGDLVEVECSDPTLTMVGEPVFWCLQSREWDKELPYCVGPSVAPPPPPPKCGHIHKYSDTAAIIPRGDFCYSFINTKMSFYDAKRHCENNGGYLVNIPDEATNDWLVETLSALPGWGNADIWLGLKYHRNSWNIGVEWRWLQSNGRYVSLEDSSFNNRRSNWRSVGDCRYMTMEEGYIGTWWKKCCSGRTCSSKYKVVCQHPTQED